MTRPVLIAVDLGTASDGVVKTGADLARATGTEPYLLYTYAFPPPSASSLYPTASQAIYAQAMLDLRRVANDCGVRVEERQLLARSGSAERLIVEHAHQLDARLIVMGTHRVRGLERMLAGSTAEAVVRRARCPVLVIPCEPVVRAHAATHVG